MTIDKIFFNSDGLKIEGLLENLSGDRGVVITHPHPLYGGDMTNNVVGALHYVYRDKGYTTLRFNFRGVGESEGIFDNGIGEQNDVRAALAYLTNLGKKKINLAGYSFGTWVNAMGIESFDQADRLIMVSPPVNMIDFTFLKYNPKIVLVITGRKDDIARFTTIGEMMSIWNSEANFKIIEGADHFYSGKTGELKAILYDFLE